jgi:hypothetical protein
MENIKQILLFYLFLIPFSSIYCLGKKDEIKNVEDLITLVNSKEFEDYIEMNEEDEVNLKDSIFSGDECLLSKKEATTLLKEKYGISNSSPDENLRFILGKCSPVVLIPGIYASKLLVELQCKNIAEKERDTTLKEIRIFCGDTVCSDESVEKEEHPLFIGLLDKAFSILGSEMDKYSSCLGYFMNHFQNENECVVVNNKHICNH